MTEEKYVPRETVESFVDNGFEPNDMDKTTHSQLMAWLREEKGIHVNILAGMERNGDVKYFLKSIIAGHMELNYKKRKFDKWEECAEFAFDLLTLG